MAHLLGSEFCLKSLSSDLSDINLITDHLLTMCSPIEAMSWKFPHKKATEIDIDYFLKEYCYVANNTEGNQIAHVIMLELIIDRYNLVFHCLLKYMALLINLPLKQSKGMSIGIVAKEFWNYMTKLSDSIKANENKNLELEKKLNNMESTLINGINNCKAATPPDMCDRFTQTVETAFVPCEQCTQVQNAFREISAHIVSLCQKEELSSSLSVYKSSKSIADDWLTPHDLLHWKTELLKDVRKVEKHFIAVREESNSLKTIRKDLELTLKGLQQTIESFDDERARDRKKQNMIKKELEEKMLSIEQQKNSQMNVIENNNKSLTENKNELESKIQCMKTELESQKALLVVLDCLQQQIKLLLPDKKNLKVEDLETAVIELHSQATLAKAKVEQESVAKQKMELRCQTLEQQVAANQEKQKQLAVRIAELTVEKDNAIDLQEEEKVTSDMKVREAELLVTSLTKVQEELTSTVRSLQARVSDLEDHLESSEQKIQQLLHYPDLNGPVETADTGNPAVDMQNQIEANELRMHLLHQQTDHLRKLVDKLQHIPVKLPPIVPNEAFVCTTPQTTEPMIDMTTTYNKEPVVLHTVGRNNSISSDTEEPAHDYQLEGQPSDRKTKTVSLWDMKPSSTTVPKNSARSTARRPTSSAKGSRNDSGSPDLILWSTPNKDLLYMCKKCNKPFKLKSQLASHSKNCQGK